MSACKVKSSCTNLYYKYTTNTFVSFTFVWLIRQEAFGDVHKVVHDFVTVESLEPNPVLQKACNRRVTKRIFYERVGYIAR
jgi:hypothetical protein